MSLIFKADALKGDKKFMFTVLGCKDLPDTDGLLNKTDPYVRVKVAGNPTKKTPTIKGSLNPVFTGDNSWLFTGGVGTWVEVICMDWDPQSRDDVVVKGSIQLTEELLEGGQQSVELQGTDSSGKTVFSRGASGKFSMTGNNFIGDNAVVSSFSSTPSFNFKAEAFKDDRKFQFTVLGCKNIPDTDGPLNKTDPYLRVKVAGNPTKKTPTIKGSLNPVFTGDNSWLFTGGVGTWVEVICMDWDPESRDDVVVKGSIQLTSAMLEGGQQSAVFQGGDTAGRFSMTGSNHIGDNARVGDMNNIDNTSGGQRVDGSGASCSVM